MAIVCLPSRLRHQMLTPEVHLGMKPIKTLPTQTPIQWAPAAPSRRQSCRDVEADHSPPSNDEVKTVWRCTSTPLYTFMTC